MKNQIKLQNFEDTVHSFPFNLDHKNQLHRLAAKRQNK